MTINDVVLIYTTVATEEDALRLARVLVAKRLVACANLLPQVRSVYRWAGQVEESNEIILLLKTRHDRQETVIKQICELHSYDCPAITVIPLVGGNPDFLAWVRSETTDEESL